MLRRASIAVIAAAASLLLVPGAAAGASPSVALQWNAPAECPGAAQVIAEVDRVLGPTASRPAKPIEAVASVLRDDQGIWRVHLETSGEGPTRVRELKGASCAAIADATALILALMIDPTASPPAPVPVPVPVLVPVPVPVLAAPTASASPAPPPRAPEGAGRQGQGQSAPPRGSLAIAPPLRPELRLFAWAGAEAGSLPVVAPAFGGTVELVLGPQRIELGAAYRPRQDGTIPGRSSAGGHVDLFTGSLGTCRALLARPVEIAPCVALEIGRLHAKGFGVLDPREGSALWTAFTAGGAFAWSPVAHLALGVRLDAAVPFVRPQFVLVDVGPVHKPSSVAGRASAGVEVRF